MESNLTNKELIEKVSEWSRRICKSGGKDWTLTVPADVRKDPDLLIQELCDRFEKLTEENNRLREVVLVAFQKGHSCGCLQEKEMSHFSLDERAKDFVKDWEEFKSQHLVLNQTK